MSSSDPARADANAAQAALVREAGVSSTAPQPAPTPSSAPAPPSPEGPMRAGSTPRPSAVLQRLIDQVREAAATARPLCITGQGSKHFLGGPLHGEPLSTLDLAGITRYEPSELFITAGAGTPLADVEAALAERGQHLAFEPPRLAAPMGGGPTLGGVVASGLSGPARWRAGAVRDHVLGAGLINGQGHWLHFGGQVMKNVAGFDISRLLAGSMGTLGLITDITLKVLPLAPASVTLRFDCDEASGVRLVNEWAAAALPLDASAWWSGTLLVRLRGARAAVETAARALVHERGGEYIPPTQSDPFWAGLRNQSDEFFTKARAAVAAAGGRVGLWRLSVPATAPALGLPGEQLLEWGGALRWACTAAAPAQVQERAAAVGGQAQLYVGTAAQRAAGWALPPLAPAAGQLQRRVKQAFDPAGIFNRGRCFEDGLGRHGADGATEANLSTGANAHAGPPADPARR